MSTGESIRPTEKARWGKRPFDKGNEQNDLMKDNRGDRGKLCQGVN